MEIQAFGKSTTIAKILPIDMGIEIGDISKKTSKGKHTTKKSCIYTISNATYIIDTPGYSAYDLYDIDYRKLSKYYDEMQDVTCKYLDCSHINEDKDCLVINNVNTGKMDKNRYERYKLIYQELKKIRDKMGW